MLKFNDNNINGWCHSDSNIIKVYRNDAILYYRVSLNGSQEPCYAVVNNISQYQDTEFIDVFNKADGKWYKLNNLNQYEEYGAYGSGRNITYYDGKLTIDDGYEYQYSGGSWVNVGEVSGSTATLPNVDFSVNYNANNYDDSTNSIAKTSGQLVDVDAVITAGTPTVNDGYISIATGTRATISGYQTYFNRDNNNPNLTIVSKQMTNGNNCHMFANRDTTYNWMYRCYSNKLTLHGSSEKGQVAVTTQPVIESVRVDSSRNVLYNNYTDNTTSSATSFSYGSTNSGKFAMFQGYASNSGENFIGDFYWVYMSQNTLTDEQIQQVIAYNEGGGGQSIYPIYYDEKADPPNNLSFSSMTEAEEYECPYVGMKATIDGQRYVFSGDSQSGYEWVSQGNTIISPLYLERTASQNGYIALGEYFTENTVIDIDFQMTHPNGNVIIGDYGSNDNDDWRVFLNYYNIINNLLVYDFNNSRVSYNVGDTYKRFHLEIGDYYIKDVSTGNYLINSTKKTSFSRPNQMYLFHMEGSQTSSSHDDYGNIYSIKIYQNGVIAKSFIPWTDGEGNYGLYDKVADEIHYSTGQMTGSSEWNYIDISGVPTGYTQLDYITTEHISPSVNNGAYINTNYYPTEKTRVVVDFQPLSSTAEHRRLFGAGHCCQANTAYVFNMEQKYTASNREYTYRCGTGNTWVHTNIPFDLDRHTVDFNNNGVIYLDNTQIGTRQNEPFTCTYPMYFLTDNNDGTAGYAQFFIGRIFSSQYYEGTARVKNLIPARRDSDSKYGLYDIVNDEFLISSTNYEFSGGTIS